MAKAAADRVRTLPFTPEPRFFRAVAATQGLARPLFMLLGAVVGSALVGWLVGLSPPTIVGIVCLATLVGVVLAVLDRARIGGRYVRQLRDAGHFQETTLEFAPEGLTARLHDGRIVQVRWDEVIHIERYATAFLLVAKSGHAWSVDDRVFAREADRDRALEIVAAGLPEP